MREREKESDEMWCDGVALETGYIYDDDDDDDDDDEVES